MNENVFAPICFSLVESVAIITVMLASDIRVDLVIPILQSARIQDRAVLTWFDVHRVIPPIDIILLILYQDSCIFS
jgi:hypothetical protein